MTRTEELLRAATRDGAAEVTPGAIRPLDLTEVPFDRPRRLRRRARRARLVRPGILVPVLAALAVVAVAAASLVVPRVLSSNARPATPSLEAPEGVPPYYAALSTTGTPALSHPMNVAVRDTATGEPLATVTPPAGLGTFTFVAGGAVDDRTWVVGAQPWKPQRIGNQLFYGLQPLTFFLLTFEPQDRVIRLEQLPGFTVTAPPGLPGAGTAQPVVGIEAAALSPDGSRLAVATSEGSAAKMLVHITPVAPGAHGGTWVLPGRLAQGDMRNPVLSWTADNRALSVATWKDLIFLDPAKPSGDLLAASRVVPFTGQAPTGITYACTNSAVMSLDGTTMTCGGSPSTDGYKLQSIGIINHLGADRDAAALPADPAVRRVGHRTFRGPVLGQPHGSRHLHRPALGLQAATQGACQPHRLAAWQGRRDDPLCQGHRPPAPPVPGAQLRVLVIRPPGARTSAHRQPDAADAE